MEFTGAARSQTAAVVRRVQQVLARQPHAASYTPGSIL
jgi:adenylosuccinate lyase